MQLSGIAMVAFMIRGLMQFGIGSYQNMIKSHFDRALLFAIFNPIFEIPQVSFLFLAHFKNFRAAQ